MASQYFAGLFEALTSQACMADTTPPTGGVISALTTNLDGSLQVTWGAASDPALPLSYAIFIQETTATGLFTSTNLVLVKRNGLTAKVYTTADDLPLRAGVTYFVGVRAIDAIGNVNTNTTSISVVATPPNYASLAGKVWDELKSAHTVVGSFGEYLDTTITSRASAVDVGTLLSRLTATRANLLDNLDAAISTRSSAADMATLLSRITSTRAALLDNLVNLDTTISSRASQTSVNNIQNNTSFSGIVQSPMILPDTGSKTYPIYARVFNEAGSPVDVDSNLVMTIKDAGGATVSGPTNMTNTGTGKYQSSYTVTSTDPERALYVFFDYSVNAIAFSQIRSTEVQEFESKLDTLLIRLSATRAGLLDNLTNLDAAVSSRLAAAGYTAPNNAGIAAIKAKTDQLLFDIDTGVISHVINSPAVDLAPVISRLDDLLKDFQVYVTTQVVQYLPSTGSKVYRVLLFTENASGAPTNPDGDNVDISVQYADGSELLAPTAMVLIDTGWFEFLYTDLNTNPKEEPLYFMFTFIWQGQTVTRAFAFEKITSAPAIDVQSIVDGVWNEPTSAHTDPGSFGLNAQTPALNPTEVADAVWDAPLAAHQDAGSTGEALVQARGSIGGDVLGYVDDPNIIAGFVDTDSVIIGLVDC